MIDSNSTPSSDPPADGPPPPASDTDHADGAKDYRYLLAALAGLIVAYLVWQYVVQPRELYLTDIEYIVEPGYSWQPPKVNQSIDGNPIKIGNTIYTQGLGAHAITEITVVPPRGARRFVAEVGVDAEMVPPQPSSVRFLVSGNGVLLATTPILRAGELPYQLSVDIEGYDELLLRLDDAGDGVNSDHGDWANARFIR